MIALARWASPRSDFPVGLDCRRFCYSSIGDLHRHAKRQRAFANIQSRAQL